MPAFSFNTVYQIHQNVHTLFRRRLAISRLTLTHEEYIQLFVPAPQRQLFRDIAPFNGLGHTYVTGELDLGQFRDEPLKGHLYIGGVCNNAPPLVKDLAVQHDAPPDVIARIKTWLENGGDVSRDFGRISKLLTMLNEGFSRGAIRHYWPSIMALCDGNEATIPLIAELQSMRPNATKPLPPGLVQACRKTAETISTARLIPDDVKEQEWGEVTLEVTRGQTYKEEGLGTFYGMN